ncbi:MAG: Holliday junction branch migration protein RuvA [Selenomonadaceae bacterium]|nr:Holliday junction branch migration protein RuvA [Selenomonadaceae bacterium]MBQ9497441.1 Holliday junction branch migration protein RuvA [Selenomonadaceae bacterium]
MIAYLSGTIKFLFDDACIVDVHGVGYKVFVDAQTRQTLTLGAATELFIHTAVREDAINLFGMKNQSTFELFELLLTVSGVGAKGALAIVSKISAAEFSRAVAAQDIKTLTRLPGVGKKSAERILLELKDKVQSLAENFSAEDFQSAQIQSTEREDAAEALEALGYTAAEISAAFDNAPENFSTEQLIKFALKNLSGR